jgi:predicted nucleic-acid-binding Zn-ribbon protein
MPGENIVCPKCKNEMIQGFIPDYSHSVIKAGSWCEGLPKKSFLGGVDPQSSVFIPIGAFRCQNCGYIEFYAKQEFAAK